MPNSRIAPTFALALVLAACGKQAPAERKDAPATVTTTTLAARPWQDGIEALGTAQARESVAITAKSSDAIVRIAFDSGDRVQAGQLLADMNSRAQRADAAAAEAALRDATQQLVRARPLVDQKLLSRSEYDTLVANRDAAAANLQSKRASIADRVLVAPFPGVLGLRKVSPGALVAPGDVIATLDDDSTIKLDFTVPEASLSSLHPGQSLRASADAWPGTTFEGRVVDVDSRIDPDSRAVTVRAEIPNPDRKLRAGMLMRVSLLLPAREALALPEIAIQQQAEQSFAFRVDGDKATQVPIKTGSRHDGLVEVVSGLKAGDRAVVDGIVKLRDGSRIVEAKQDASGAGGASAAARGD